MVNSTGLTEHNTLNQEVTQEYPVDGEYESATSYNIHGVSTSFWKTVATTANSMNYFTNGIVSDEYFIIEGYLNHCRKFGVTMEG